MKWLPVFAAGLFAVITLVWLAQDPAVSRELHGAGSSLDLDDQGTSRLRAYLAGPAGLRVATLARPLGHELLPADGVVFRIHPQNVELLLRALRSAMHDGDAGKPLPVADLGILSPDEERWISNGGRLVLAIDEPYRGLKPVSTATTPQTVLPLADGTWSLAPLHGRALAGAALEQAVAVVVAGDQPVLLRQRIGNGDLWLLATPEVWSNQQLATSDHLALALALAGHRPVWFDESVHGLDRDVGPLELAQRWGLGPLLLLGLLAGVLHVWRHGRILGPVADPWSDHRSEAIDGIAALAVLYGRALTDRALLALFQQRLVRETSFRLGVRPQKATELVHRQLGPPRTQEATPAAFAARLAQLITAYRNLRNEHRRRRR